MAFRYFDYFGRPARMTVDDKDIPELCEVWDPAQKKLVADSAVETDCFFGVTGAPMISEEEFKALVKKRVADSSEPPVHVGLTPKDGK